MPTGPMTSIGNSVQRWMQRMFKVEYCTVLKVNKYGEHGVQCHSPDHPEYYNTVTVKVRDARKDVKPTDLEHQYEIVIQDFVGNCFGHPWTPRVGDLVQVLFIQNAQPVILGPVNTTYQAPPMRGPTCADAMYDEVWKWCQWLEPTQDKNHDYKDHPKGKMPICRKLFHGPVTGLPDGKGRDEMFVWDCQMGDDDPTCENCWIIDSLPRSGEQWFKQYSTKTESLQAYNSRAEWHSRCGSYLRFESDDENPTANSSLEYSEGIGHIRLGNATTETTKKGHINFHPTGSIDIHSAHEEVPLNQEDEGARTLVTGSGLSLTDAHGTIACESIYLPLQAYSRIYRDGSIHHTANNNSQYGRSKLYLESDGTCGLWNIVSNDYVEITDEEITLDSPITHVTGELLVDGGCAGGTAAGGDLSIDSTTSATKGSINIGCAGTGSKIVFAQATATDNSSPGLSCGGDDDFLYDSVYINHYGFGCWGGQANTKTYMSGYYGIQLFTGGASRFTIDAAGSAGIGTTAPVAIGSGYGSLDIRGTNGGGLRFGKTSGAHGQLYHAVGNIYLDASDNSPILLNPSGGRVTIGQNWAPRSLLDLGYPDVNDCDHFLTVGNYLRAGAAYCNADTYLTWNAILTTSSESTNKFTPVYNPGYGFALRGSFGEYLYLYGINWNSSSSEKALSDFTGVFAFKYDGKLGIGTDTPYEKLEVNGAISASGGMNANASQGAVCSIGFNSGGNYGFIQAVDWGNEYKTLYLQPNGGSTAVAGYFSAQGDVYITNNCSALSFTDRTPFYDGDALKELKGIKGKDGKIDHESLPEFAKKKLNIKESGKEDKEEIGRDLGAMVSILTKAVQQLTEKLEAAEEKIKTLESTVKHT